MSKTKLVSCLKIGFAAGLSSVLFQALLDGINDINYFRATTIGAVVALLFFLFRVGSSEKKEVGG